MTPRRPKGQFHEHNVQCNSATKVMWSPITSVDSEHVVARVGPAYVADDARGGHYKRIVEPRQHRLLLISCDLG